MACLHRVKYLCVRPPMCMLFVCTCKHEYAPQRSGLSCCEKKRKKRKKYMQCLICLVTDGWLIRRLGWSLHNLDCKSPRLHEVQLAIQIQFPILPRLTFKLIRSLAPSVCFLFLIRVLHFCGCFWLELQSAGGGRGGETEKAG